MKFMVVHTYVASYRCSYLLNLETPYVATIFQVGPGQANYASIIFSIIATYRDLKASDIMPT